MKNCLKLVKPQELIGKWDLLDDLIDTTNVFVENNPINKNIKNTGDDLLKAIAKL